MLGFRKNSQGLFVFVVSTWLVERREVGGERGGDECITVSRLSDKKSTCGFVSLVLVVVSLSFLEIKRVFYFLFSCRFLSRVIAARLPCPALLCFALHDAQQKVLRVRGRLSAHAVSGGAPASGGRAGGRHRDDVTPAVGARGGPGVLLGRAGGAVGVAEGEGVDAGRRGMVGVWSVQCVLC